MREKNGVNFVKDLRLKIYTKNFPKYEVIDGNGDNAFVNIN